MNKKFKSVVSAILTAAIVFALFAVAPLAADADISVKADKASYLEGETVNVQVYFPKAFNKVAAMDFSLTYDRTKLDVVSVVPGKGLKDARNAQKNGDVYSESHKTPGSINWSLAATSNYDFKGVFAEITFEVRPTAGNGSCELALKVANAYNSGYVDVKSAFTVGQTGFTVAREAANSLAFALNPDGTGYIITAYTVADCDTITIPEKYRGLPVVEIGNDVFTNHGELKSVVIPETVTKIGDRAFNNCSGLESIIVPDAVTSIGEEAFRNCSGLESVVLPVALKNIKDRTFFGCAFLESIELPFTLKTIGVSAFENCVSLSKVKISKNTDSIGNKAFYNCTDNIEFVTVADNTYLPGYVESKLPEATITIVKDISLGKVEAVKTQQYTGREVKPEIKIILDSGETVALDKDYRVVYMNNTEIGAAKAYVAAIGAYGEGYIVDFDIACEHSYSAPVITKTPTCTENGKSERTCKVCGFVETTVIPALGHSSNIWVYDVRPTIFKTGIKHKVCDVCQTVFEKNTIAPKVYPDVDESGKINSADALEVLLYSVGAESKIKTEDQFVTADTNGDGRVNSVDALNILQIAVGSITI